MNKRIDDPPRSPVRPARSPRAFLFTVFGLLALPLTWRLLSLYAGAHSDSLILPLRTPAPLTATIEMETGQTPPQTLSLTAQIPASDRPQGARFQVPWGRIKSVRLHFTSATPLPAIAVGDLQLATDDDGTVNAGSTIATLSAASFQPGPGIANVSAESAAWTRLTPQPGATEGEIALTLPVPLSLEFDVAAFAGDAALSLLVYGLAGLGAWMLWRNRPGWQHAHRRLEAAQIHWTRRAGRWTRRQPHRAIWLAGLAGVLMSCYPVVFCGKSFVSPNATISLLYDHLPTLPGYQDGRRMNNQLSDVAATMLAFVPYSAVEHRALFEDHELPVWHRDDAGGIPLLGQGMSMLGDPLHWLPILSNGAAWAWDLKFLLAKWLFAAGVGFTVLAATRCLRSAVLLSWVACFIGFFVHRFNHPTFFSVSYAPWILLAWLLVARGDNGRRGYGLWLLANWMELNSGTAKEAYLLLLMLNAGGASLLLLAGEGGWAARWRRLAAIAFCGACFLLVSAPIWVTFVDTLTHSWSHSAEAGALQIQPGLLIGFFDDIFYRQFNASQTLFNPGLNFVVLLGLAFAAAHFKGLLSDRAFVALAIGALPAVALVFGVVPPAWICAAPFLANVMHIDSTFSCPLIVSGLVLSGFGFREGFRRLRHPDGVLDAVVVAVVLAVLLGAFFGLVQASQGSTYNPHAALNGLTLSPFFAVYVGTLTLAFCALPFFARRLASDRGRTLLGLAPVILLCLGAMTWRQGLHLPGLSYDLVMSPGVRANLQAPSAAVNSIRERQSQEPGRTMGFGLCLAPGFNALYGLESPSGVDALQNPLYHALLEGSGVEYWTAWYLMTERPLTPGTRRFFDALNIRYYLDEPRNGATIPSGLSRAGRFDLDVYESPTTWPRAFFVDGVTSHGNLRDFYSEITAGDGRPFVSLEKGTGVFEESIDPARRLVVPATDYRLTSRTTTFHVRAPRAGVVALLEGYQEHGVTATLNGEAVERFRVNYAFEGIVLPNAGDYTITFSYWPRYLSGALGASALGLLLLGAAFRWISIAPVLRRNGRTLALAPLGPGAARETKGAP